MYWNPIIIIVFDFITRAIQRSTVSIFKTMKKIVRFCIKNRIRKLIEFSVTRAQGPFKQQMYRCQPKDSETRPMTFSFALAQPQAVSLLTRDHFPFSLTSSHESKGQQ